MKRFTSEPSSQVNKVALIAGVLGILGGSVATAHGLQSLDIVSVALGMFAIVCFGSVTWKIRNNQSIFGIKKKQEFEEED